MKFVFLTGGCCRPVCVLERASISKLAPGRVTSG